MLDHLTECRIAVETQIAKINNDKENDLLTIFNIPITKKFLSNLGNLFATGLVFVIPYAITFYNNTSVNEDEEL